MSLLRDLLEEPLTSKVYLWLARLEPTQSKTAWQIAEDNGLDSFEVEQALQTLVQAGLVRVVDCSSLEGSVKGFLLDRAAAQAAQVITRPAPKPGPRARPSELAERSL